MLSVPTVLGVLEKQLSNYSAHLKAVKEEM
jgi:hypothetical protein